MKNKTRQAPNTIKINQEVIDNPKTIANKLNEYFCNIAKTLQQKLPQPNNNQQFKNYLQHPIPESIYLNPPTPTEILNTIQSLITKKSMGNDDILSFFVRCIAKELSSYLCELFCYAFEFGVFPGGFKTARVIPIYKSGSKSEMNYCPISLLTCFLKIIENIDC